MPAGLSTRGFGPVRAVFRSHLQHLGLRLDPCLRTSKPAARHHDLCSRPQLPDALLTVTGTVTSSAWAEKWIVVVTNCLRLLP
jgi:hypothetical protein